MRRSGWVLAMMLVVTLRAFDASAAADAQAQDPSQALDFPSYVGYAATGHAMAWSSLLALTAWPFLWSEYLYGGEQSDSCLIACGSGGDGFLISAWTVFSVGYSSLLVGMPLMMKSLRMAMGAALAAGVEDVGGPEIQRRQIAAWVFYALAITLPVADGLLAVMIFPIPYAAIFATIAVLLAESAWSRVNRQIRDAGMVVKEPKVSLVPGVAPVEGGAVLVLTGSF